MINNIELPVNLDLHRVVFIQVGLSVLASASVSPSYNLPVHLYGLYNVDNDLNQFPGAAEGLRQYSILLVVTFVLDLIWMYNWSSSTSALPFILILIGLVIKPISLITCLSQLNQTTPGTTFAPTFSRPGHRLPSAAPLPQRQHGTPDHSRVFQRDPAASNYRPTVTSPHNPTKPGPSAVSHQAQSAHIIQPGPYHEFELDADAQNLDDSDLHAAKQELEFRIAQKQQRQQQQHHHQQQPPTGPGLVSSVASQQIPALSSQPPLPVSTQPPVDVGRAKEPLTNTGYHTLE
ncbi:hypothetical protein CROQUDRAFT_671036 [Cronartium quercuum f. sp. fusiforme G11]|uniref:Uncharacterized protein n=1 Tax=Cronartium quercuum f. sp. fusiforme G11 TaxID=708437 RepID=A0A9P6NIJ4_9BASI|nr:hypothetical protein CROQUDRAFT_671036 [Cronartium quercuum f. sp. fusiforme G11]